MTNAVTLVVISRSVLPCPSLLWAALCAGYFCTYRSRHRFSCLPICEPRPLTNYPYRKFIAAGSSTMKKSAVSFTIKASELSQTRTASFARLLSAEDFALQADKMIDKPRALLQLTPQPPLPRLLLLGPSILRLQHPSLPPKQPNHHPARS